jgi:aryl-alcohol dehydrogenase-like predicted oxidoreductase
MNGNKSATPEGTARYAMRLDRSTAAEHFRQQQGLQMSSIGVGTALGNCDDQTDESYRQTIMRAFKTGVNVFDSAINYRYQRSERAIGGALRSLLDFGQGSRDEVIVTTKGGCFAFDEDLRRSNDDWITENVINKGLAHSDDIVNSGHCISPQYLENQLSNSLLNLGLDCVDIYYVHNPETQLETVSRKDFNNRMLKAFELLERAVADGRLGIYGTATWNGYRQESDAPTYLSLAELVTLAREVGGERHHFRAIQLPFNLAKPEAVLMANQVVNGERMSVLSAAALFEITVMCSAPIQHGLLARYVPELVSELFDGLTTDAQRAIQFVRSTPGVTTAIVGMSSPAHVEENLKVAQIPTASIEDLFRVDDEQES